VGARGSADPQPAGVPQVRRGAFPFVFIPGDLELVEQKFEEGFLAGRVLGGHVIDFLLQALEVGGGDLQG
jgi:hypothetical protein